MRRHDRYNGSSNGRSRYSSGPYDRRSDRRSEQHWKFKANVTDGDLSSSAVQHTAKHQTHVSRQHNSIGGVVDHASVPESHVSLTTDEEDSSRKSTHTGIAPTNKRLASKIVTPTADESILKRYVTTRDKGVTKSLCFSQDVGQDLDGGDQMIGALNDMDNLDQGVDMMEVEHTDEVLNDDDLLGEELREAEETNTGSQPERTENREVKAGSTSVRSRHHGGGPRSLSSSVGDLQVNDQSPAPGKLEVLDSTLGKGHLGFET
ncbi:unnamed protein product [Eruca vesicaria subsp. sativa]|uniref:Uncharacterized protein n=1 Tax=Eruca vesicaria subsp. sativa TaxID=29727 RepID=A0ABC8LXD8_ERUVS|nr:unnamed protein product [Eruca vesicaria subsp. sativa]